MTDASRIKALSDPVRITHDGEAVTVEVEFVLRLPQVQGRWGQWRGVTSLSNWLPVLAFYDDRGWQPTPYIPWHQPFFNEAGLYTVRLTLPAELAALANVSLCDTLEAVRHADIVALLVGHSRFRRIPREELMRRVVIDVTGLTHATA